MRQTYGANFISQSVAILTPVLVFLGPFVAFSIAMQWDFSPKESFNIFYGLFFGGLTWFLVCVAACLCTAMPRNSVPENQFLENGVRRFSKKNLKVLFMLFFIAVGLTIMHRYDLSEKKERYEIVHRKFCEQDLSQPLQQLMETHKKFELDEQKNFAANTAKESYMEVLNNLSAWIESSSWETTVLMTDRDSITFFSSTTNYLPVQKKSVRDNPGLALLSLPLGLPSCDIVAINGRWNSLRVLSYEGQKPIAILTKVRDERSRY
jgi:hypothetical protein